ncbi:hypothetical protein H4Q26_002637 [Puccinia striiformis f. sp. tritici PST-130]|nr:hypothetical protein H4Q26_002637 [Puccinia striiformis f. sp. tritici PST-130]
MRHFSLNFLVVSFVSAKHLATSTKHQPRDSYSPSETAARYGVRRLHCYVRAINQNIGSSDTPSQDRLNSMAATINSTLNSINDAANKILSQSNGALHYQDLKDCIAEWCNRALFTERHVNHWGVEYHDECLKNFGNNAIHPPFFMRPAKPLIRRLQRLFRRADLYDSVNSAITSVQASLTQDCNRSPKGASVYNDLKTLYLSVTNQFVGYLQPNIIDSVHDIPITTWTRAIQNQTRLISEKLLPTRRHLWWPQMLEIKYVFPVAPRKNAILNVYYSHSQPDGPPASVKQIVYGYVQQVDHQSLKPHPIQDSNPPKLKLLVLPNGSGRPAIPIQGRRIARHFREDQRRSRIRDMLRNIVDCLFNSRNGALAKPGNTQSVCLLGDACQKTPDGKANLAVPFGRRSLSSSYSEHLLRRLASMPTAVQKSQDRSQVHYHFPSGATCSPRSINNSTRRYFKPA